MRLHWTGRFCVLLATAVAAPPASATIALIANGTLTGSAAGPDADLSGLTGTLENGVPANLLGGLGSGIAFAGGDTFLAVPDRGPTCHPSIRLHTGLTGRRTRRGMTILTACDAGGWGRL
jgi:hypothetical protein